MSDFIVGGSATRTRGHELTARIRAGGVVRAITAMRERLGEHQELGDAARAALMSPFHFHRVFRSITMATPGRFLTAMRMSEAKRLLLESDMSATDISITVGYASFGTFTSQFTKLVGLPPGRFRASAAPIADLPMKALLDRVPPPAEGDLRGWIGARPDAAAGVAAIGLFPSTIAQECPQSCSLVAPPAPFALSAATPLDGAHAVLAASVRAEATVREVLIGSPAAGLCVGVGEHGGDGLDIRLREPSIVDAPILIAFPLLALAD